MTQAEKMFWHIRRLLGVRDFDDAPDVDHAIRTELEMCSLARQRVSLASIEDRLRMQRDQEASV